MCDAYALGMWVRGSGGQRLCLSLLGVIPIFDRDKGFWAVMARQARDAYRGYGISVRASREPFLNLISALYDEAERGTVRAWGGYAI